jgi:hypothetical protein
MKPFIPKRLKNNKKVLTTKGTKKTFVTLINPDTATVNNLVNQRLSVFVKVKIPLFVALVVQFAFILAFISVSLSEILQSFG